jgi:hypothetical protein
MVHPLQNPLHISLNHSLQIHYIFHCTVHCTVKMLAHTLSVHNGRSKTWSVTNGSGKDAVNNRPTNSQQWWVSQRLEQPIGSDYKKTIGANKAVNKKSDLSGQKRKNGL